MSDQSAIKRALESNWQPTDREGYELLTDVFINSQCYGEAHIEKAKAFLLELPHDWYSKRYRGYSLYDIQFEFESIWKSYRDTLDNLSENALARGLDEVWSDRNEQHIESHAKNRGFKNYLHWRKTIEAPENIVLTEIVTQDRYDMGYWITRDDTAEHEDWAEIRVTHNDNTVMFRAFETEEECKNFCYEKGRETGKEFTPCVVDYDPVGDGVNEIKVWLALPPKAPIFNDKTIFSMEIVHYG